MRGATQRLQHVDVCKTQRSQIEDDGCDIESAVGVSGGGEEVDGCGEGEWHGLFI